jgi:hypothetical protein
MPKMTALIDIYRYQGKGLYSLHLSSIVLLCDRPSKKRRTKRRFSLPNQGLFLGLRTAGGRDDVIHPQVHDGLTVVIEWVSE